MEKTKVINSDSPSVRACGVCSIKHTWAQVCMNNRRCPLSCSSALCLTALNGGLSLKLEPGWHQEVSATLAMGLLALPHPGLAFSVGPGDLNTGPYSGTTCTLPY